MYENIKLAILGGDLRQLALARRISSIGFETAVWGLGSCDGEIGDAVRSCSWEDAVRSANAVILPLPASYDGVRINCPMNDTDTVSPKMTVLLDTLEKGTLITGGKFTPKFKAAAEVGGFRIVDFFESEELQIKNAVPTAEGAIAIAMSELPRTVDGAKVAVIGYGRVGRVLAERLGALGANVTVAARKSRDIAWAQNSRFDTAKISVCDGVSSLETLTRGYDVIFNTVPHWLLDAAILGKMQKSTLIIDLASAPGGVDSRAAGDCGIRVIWALSLPGKCSPFTAGEIICDSIIEILRSEGLIL